MGNSLSRIQSARGSRGIKSKMVLSSLFHSRKSMAGKPPSAPTSPVTDILKTPEVPKIPEMSEVSEAPAKKEPSRRSSICDDDNVVTTPVNGVESGYASAETSDSGLAEVYFTKPHLKFINQQLSKLSPQAILKWCLISLPGLYQTTAFGPSGLVTLDMLSKLDGPIKPQIDLIFLDTLHHFPETLALVDRVKRKYPFHVHIYKPDGCDNEEEFAAKHGSQLWDTNEELYDWVAKVEPAQRAYAELQVKAVLTGRRRSQGGKRGDIDIVEVDEAGMIKVNPLANWTFDDVQSYIKENDVPYNELLERGYKSVGDWHSTQPVTDGGDERSGRWKGTKKTECGIHNPKSRYAQFLMQQELAKQAEIDQVAQALQNVSVAA